MLSFCERAEIPAWLSSMESAWLVKGGKMTPTKIGQKGRGVTVELDSLQDGVIILMGEKYLAGSITPNTKSLLP